MSFATHCWLDQVTNMSSTRTAESGGRVKVHGPMQELLNRCTRDLLRMKRWRLFHRWIALLFTAVMIVLPAVLVSGLIPETDSTIYKVLLLIIAITAGFNSAFSPSLHSAMRRSDMNSTRRLRDRLLAELDRPLSEIDHADIYRRYAEEFAAMYEQRGDHLIESTLLQSKQHSAEAADRRG